MQSYRRVQDVYFRVTFEEGEDPTSVATTPAGRALGLGSYAC